MPGLIGAAVMVTTMLISTTTGESLSEFHHQILWALIVGAILAFVLGFGMGANDVSNAFGTSVGSGVLNLKWAYFLATIFETLGAVLVGYNVTDTMRKGVVDTDLYADDPKLLLVGQLAILGGTSAWLIIATFSELPVSTTQSVVGATVGFSVVCKGLHGIRWWEIGKIILSWVVSPLLSGTVSAALYIILDFAVLRRNEPLICGLKALPVFYFFCIAFNTFAVSYQGSKILHLASVPLWLAFVISFAAGIVAALIVHFVMKPRLLAWVNRRNTIRASIHHTLSMSVPANAVALDLGNGELKKDPNSISFIETPTSTPNTLAVPTMQQYPVRRATLRLPDGTLAAPWHEMNLPTELFNPNEQQRLEWTAKGFIRWFLPARERKDDKRTLKLFSSIQVFTACFAGFAHGANDVSNAIAPLTALLAIYTSGSVLQDQPTPIYVLLFGVLAICVGLCCLGHKVIKTVGQKMSHIHPASGFTIEFGAAVTALLASKAGLPISTTHCLVGSVVAVGCIKAGEGIRWGIFRNVVLSWLVTLPVSGIIAAGLMFLLRMTV
ncbi:phosphate permease [Aphelenchoides avenae]|nr:phosphate permease [Aphelenchus avenae]